MSEMIELGEQGTAVRSSRWQRLWHHLTENPITIKELRGRMRGARAFIVLTSYLVIMTAFVMFTYLIVEINDSSTSNSSRTAGQAIFFTLVTVQTFLVIFIAPAFTSGAISGEKERQTFELLRTTLLSGRSFVIGKLISALSYVFLLVLAAVPLISIAFMLGGVAASELVISQLLLLVAAVTFAMIGLFFSSTMRSTLAASVATYLTVIGLTIGIPILFGFGAAIITPLMFGMGGVTENIMEIVMAYAVTFLSWFNLPTTMVMSDLMLREENSLWGMMSSAGRYSYFWPSPWYGFLLMNLLLSWLIYRRTVKRIEKVADK